MKLWKKILIGLGVLVVVAAAGFTYMIGGPRNVIGMIRYDPRQEGKLGSATGRPTCCCSRSTARRP